MVKFTSAIALCATLCIATAVRVVPGPGFPTLEELGITEADLAPPDEPFFSFEQDGEAAKAKPTKTTKITKTTTIPPGGHTPTPSCSSENQCSIFDAGYCIRYLRMIGDQNCTVKGRVELETVECGSAKVFLGQQRFGKATILCKYVAQFAKQIKDTCKHKGMVAGTQVFPKKLYTASYPQKMLGDLFVDLRQYNGSGSSS